jgi:hypothetical protein
VAGPEWVSKFTEEKIMSRTTTMLPITAATTALVAAVGLFGYLTLGDADASPKPTPSIVRQTTDPAASPFVCPESRVYPPSAC